MIVFKNDIEEADKNLEDSPKGPITFTINDIDITLTKNYPQIHEKINNLNENDDESEIIKITIPDLSIVKKQAISKIYRNHSDSDDDNYHENYEYSRYSEYSHQYRHDVNYKNVFCSNFDNRNIDERRNDDIDYNYPYTRSVYRINSREYGDSSSNYSNNKMISGSDFPMVQNLNIQSNSAVFNTFLAIEQFQLILDGFDILIPDFIVDDMLKIAEKFEIQELIDSIIPLKEQINDLQNYNKFSELEILIHLEDMLTSIEDDNFDEQISVIYSIYLYLDEKLFKSILQCFSFIYPKKYHIYLQIAEMINNKYHDFEFRVNFERSVSYSSSYYSERNPYEYEYYGIRTKTIHVNDDMLKIIQEDDSDSLQKLSCNPKFQFSNEVVILKLYESFKNSIIPPKCNAIECAAFYGALKCFKFLLLNDKLETSNLAKYAIAGGNTEIIHICEQKKHSFRNTLKIAIDYHHNDIAEWIVDTDKDSIQEDIYEACIDARNFDMLQFFLNRKSESTLNDAKLCAKYILYIKQYYGYNDRKSSEFYDFIMKYKCMKYQDEFGLIYCPNEKAELLDIFYSDPRDCSEMLSSPVIKAAYNGDLEMCKFLPKHQKIVPRYYTEENDDGDYDYAQYEYFDGQVRRRIRTKAEDWKLNIISDLSAVLILVFL